MIYKETFLVLLYKNHTIENNNGYFVKIGKIKEFNDEFKNQKIIMLQNILNYDNHKEQAVISNYQIRTINFGMEKIDIRAFFTFI